MPTNLQEFEDDTGFERLILDRVTPLLPQSEASSVLDLDANSLRATPTVAMASSDSTSGLPGADLKFDDVRPLFVGAAWKVLDLLIEFGLEQAGVAANQGKRFTFGFKVQRARAGSVQPVAPFDRHPDLWLRLAHTYASTEELRNSLVHRRYTVDQLTGDLQGSPREPGGAVPRSLSKDEQTALCQAAIGAADVVIRGDMPTRRVEQLRWVLDLLVSHHAQPTLGSSSAHALIPVLRLRLAPESSNELTLDAGGIRTSAQAAYADATYFDLEVLLPDGRVLAAPLEDVPNRPVTFSIDSLPGWIQWK
ncbi:hypothetical protein ACQF36_22800 [Streptomyces sp. Marseille-Q5077]|uniref:hypothetical protein n=1 Tax=Streptomyces sp. Marseille-Q5077 TaxID=3418995 RepID=UPI003D0375D6